MFINGFKVCATFVKGKQNNTTTRQCTHGLRVGSVSPRGVRTSPSRATRSTTSGPHDNLSRRAADARHCRGCFPPCRELALSTGGMEVSPARGAFPRLTDQITPQREHGQALIGPESADANACRSCCASVGCIFHVQSRDFADIDWRCLRNKLSPSLTQHAVSALFYRMLSL